MIFMNSIQVLIIKQFMYKQRIIQNNILMNVQKIIMSLFQMMERESVFQIKI